MKLIAVANQKGGVGKTTIARHLAFYGARKKKLKTLAWDFDVQRNFTTTLENLRESAGLVAAADELVVSRLLDGSQLNLRPSKAEEFIDYVAADEAITTIERSDLRQVIAAGQASVRALSKEYDLCVIDTGPSVSNLLIVALSLADFAISPCKPDRDAISGLAGFFSNVVRVRDESGINPRLASLGVLPNQLVPRRGYHRDMVAEMRSAWGDGVLPVQLNERAAIDVAKDRPVWETERGESRGLPAKEMLAVCDHVFKRMGF
jgi:chromosome partitioning protein